MMLAIRIILFSSSSLTIKVTLTWRWDIVGGSKLPPRIATLFTVDTDGYGNYGCVYSSSYWATKDSNWSVTELLTVIAS